MDTYYFIRGQYSTMETCDKGTQEEGGKEQNNAHIRRSQRGRKGNYCGRQLVLVVVDE